MAAHILPHYISTSTRTLFWKRIARATFRLKRTSPFRLFVVITFFPAIHSLSNLFHQRKWINDNRTDVRSTTERTFLCPSIRCGNIWRWCGIQARFKDLSLGWWENGEEVEERNWGKEWLRRNEKEWGRDWRNGKGVNGGSDRGREMGGRGGGSRQTVRKMKRETR